MTASVSAENLDYQSYNLILTGTLPNSVVTRVRVEGPDLKEPLDIVIPTPNGALQNGVSIPIGKERIVSFQASNADEKIIYEGSLPLTVASNVNAPVKLSMKSIIDGTPATVQIASHRLDVQAMTVRTPKSSITRIEARLFDANGEMVDVSPDDVQWDINDPWIREQMMPCKGGNGPPPACIQFLQYKPDLTDTVVWPCFKKIFCNIALVPPTPPVWSAISVGLGDHACALTKSGTAYCWGQGEHGQLGVTVAKNCRQVFFDPTLHEEPWGCSTIPVQVVCPNGACNFVAISAGFKHTCAIDSAQDAWCWGSNFAGEIGDGTSNSASIGNPTPRLVTGGHKFTAISAGTHFTCGLTVQHRVLCWGDNGNAIIPNSFTDQVLTPTDVNILGNSESIDVGFVHACARATMGRLYCWGANTIEHLLGSTGFVSSPRCTTCPAVPRLMQFADIPALDMKLVDAVSAGMHLTCAHVTTGENSCWGTAVPQRSNSPTPDYLSAGGSAYCTVVNRGPTCAGNGHNGVLGDGSFAFGLRGPTRPLAKPFDYVAIEMGITSGCGIGTDDQLYCWGQNTHGKLGDGTLNESARPVAVAITLFP
jgi:hypothetical protein